MTDPGDQLVHPQETCPETLDLFAPFDGADYVDERDRPRLTGQILRVYECAAGEKWHTLREIADHTGDPEASVSAQLRHLRKEKFGSHDVQRRHRGDPARGLYEYRVVP